MFDADVSHSSPSRCAPTKSEGAPGRVLSGFYERKHYCTRCRHQATNGWTRGRGGEGRGEPLKAHGLKLRNDIISEDSWTFGSQGLSCLDVYRLETGVSVCVCVSGGVLYIV